MFTADKPFIEPGLFTDRNFVVGLLLMFTVGVMLLATMALLPPFLQSLLGFPVITAGYVLAPRGVGTMVAMMVVGRLVGKVDTRVLVLTGLGLMAWSLHEMTQWNADVGVADIVYTGIVQGVGLGFIFVPLSAIAFATLAPRYRNEGTAMFSLIRNFGSSVGISLVMTVLGHEAQQSHAQLSASITPFRDALQAPGVPPLWNLVHGARPRRARRRGDAAGADDRVPQRLSLHDVSLRCSPCRCCCCCARRARRPRLRRVGGRRRNPLFRLGEYEDVLARQPRIDAR